MKTWISACLVMATCFASTGWAQTAIQNRREGFNRLFLQHHLRTLNQMGMQASPTGVVIGSRYTGGAPGIELLARLPELSSIEIVNPPTNLTGSALLSVGRLPQLRILRMERMRLSNNSLSNLRNANQLTELRLVQTGISDHGLRTLGSARQLEVATISEQRVTGQGLSHLRRATKLRQLVLDESGITDRSIPYLESLTQVKLLSVEKTTVSEQALAELWNKNPGLAIIGPLGGPAVKKGESFPSPQQAQAARNSRRAGSGFVRDQDDPGTRRAGSRFRRPETP